MNKTYEPQLIEDKIYKNWMEKGYFTGHVDKDKEPFTIVIPPPNVTGELHMGHALDNSLQDTIIRFKRMQGYSALWLPGTDHASIATEARVVDKLKEEGLSKEELGREKFLEYAWAWKNEYGGKIINQLKKLGCSCDWTRERFTMDEGLTDAVLEVFVRLYNKGLIYRRERITNWCPSCQTSISDIEVEHEEHDGHFWHINYPIKDSEEFISIATTRPETMLGDTAVAVNPNDERYKDLIGKTIILPLLNREIPIIADDYVDKEFGTGVVKITPAHDPNDYEIGLRHNLAIIKIMDEKGIITKEGGPYEGLDRYQARAKIVKDLKKANLLIKIEDHKHNVGTCQRCNTVIEPFISLQWYVSMEELAKPAIEAVKRGDTEFIPDRFAKIYFNWMENIQDWCISRQLWWGHRIPAYYCQSCGEILVSKTEPETCTKCKGQDFIQDPDTLDTWFSSALWPFSTLGWPEETEDFKYFYPTNVLVTGYDIIFFWVARMIFSALEYTGKTPFDHVLIHGLVRAEDGRKMSKSLGNGVDPLEEIDKYGTDSLRYALIFGNSPGNDQRYLENRTIAARNFTNKIWNATRFVLMNFDDNLDFSKVDPNKFTLYDKWILSKSNYLVKEVTDNLNKYELGIALGKINDFIWDIYCDWYIEIVKPRLFDIENDTRLEAQYVLNEVLVKGLKLLHPFMPFITEELYLSLVHESESIMISKWPVFDPSLVFKKEEDDTNMVIDAIRAIRNIRQELNVPASKKASLIIVASKEIREIMENSKALLSRLASVSELVTAEDGKDIPKNSASAVIPNIEIFIPLDELIDIGKEIERLEKELSHLEDELELVNKKLSNKAFVDKAPAKVVEGEREKLEKYREMHKLVSERIGALKG